MSEYHKIQSLYLRDPATKHKTFLEGQYTIPEFEYLANLDWVFTEKVDGTNVRIYWDATKDLVVFGGRTDNAQMPVTLMAALHELFTVERLKEALPEGESWTLYGEGYGAKIQAGGGDYIPNGNSFILFDVNCDGVWLSRESVDDIAKKLGIRSVPIVDVGPISKAEKLCREGFPSVLKKTPPEGLVMRPFTELLTRRGHRIITKLKLRDFHA